MHICITCIGHVLVKIADICHLFDSHTPSHQVDPVTVAYTLGYLAGIHAVSAEKKRTVCEAVHLRNLAGRNTNASFTTGPLTEVCVAG